MFPNQISFEDNECSLLMVEADLVGTVTQTLHKNTPPITKNILKIIYDTVGPELIATHALPTPREMTDHQYLNMLNNSIISDKK